MPFSEAVKKAAKDEITAGLFWLPFTLQQDLIPIDCLSLIVFLERHFLVPLSETPGRIPSPPISRISCKGEGHIRPHWDQYVSFSACRWIASITQQIIKKQRICTERQRSAFNLCMRICRNYRVMVTTVMLY